MDNSTIKVIADAMLEKKKAEQAKKEKDADKELERQLREVINGEKHS